MDKKRPKPKHAIPGKQDFQKIHEAPKHEDLEKYGIAGLNHEQIASILGMSKDTLERFFKSDPTLHAAVEKGKSNSILKVAGTAYQMAVSGDVPAMTMFYLKTRAKWKETHVVEERPDDDTQAKLDQMAEEIKRIAKKPSYD